MAESKAFQTWAKRTAAQLSGAKSVEQQVEEAMNPSNLKVEVRQNGAWADET